MSKRTLSEQILHEAGTNVAGSLVIDDVTSLEQLLSQHQPKQNWWVHLGYVNDVSMNKSNRNRPADNEKFGRSVGDERINNYLDSEDYKHSDEVVYGGNGRPLKSSPYQPPKNPYADALLSVLDVTIQWNARGYQEKMNFENGLRDRYLSVPRRLQKFIQSNDFRKRAEGYAKDHGLEIEDIMSQAANDEDLVKTIAKYVSRANTNKGGGWQTDPMTSIATHDETGNKALRAYTPGSRKIKAKYYLVSGEKVEEVPENFKRFWEREFGPAPKAQPDSNLENLIKRLSKWSFADYLLNKIIYMTFSYVDQEGQNVKFTYVNKDFNINNHPAAVAQYFVDKFSKEKIMPESIVKRPNIVLTESTLNEVISRAVKTIIENNIKI